MRFMIIVPGSRATERGEPGTKEQLADLQQYNERLFRAGVLVSGEGLQPSAKGALVARTDVDWVVTDGPFAESKEIIAGFTIIDVSSREEAIEWVRKWPVSCAPGPGQALELRQVQTPEDFGDEMTPALREREEHLREERLREAASRNAAQG